MQVVPLQAVPNQAVSIALNGQNCQIQVFQKTTPDGYDALYVNLFVDDALVVGGVIARNANLIVRDLYLGFSGDLAFWDSQGTPQPDGSTAPMDPTYDGLGGRYVFYYLTPSDVTAGLIPA